LLLNLRLLAAGGGLLAHTKLTIIFYLIFSQTPRQKEPGDLNFYPVEVNYGDAVQEFHIGLGSMAVPGNMEFFMSTNN